MYTTIFASNKMAQMASRLATAPAAMLWFTLPAWGGDLSFDVRKGQSGPDHSDGGYFEIGLNATAYTNPIYGQPRGNNSANELHLEQDLEINARYQYHGWFAEAFTQSFESLTLGYSLHSDPQWSLDWVGMVQHTPRDNELNPDWEGLPKRRFDFMSGPRITFYTGNYIIQALLLTDASNTHHGQLYSLRLARYWQYRNWNFHAITGATYRSENLVDYYFSIAPEDASEKFPAANIDGGMAYVVELGVSYPLSEKWVFRSFVRSIHLDQQATRSPLIMTTHGEALSVSVSYVF